MKIIGILFYNDYTLKDSRFDLNFIGWFSRGTTQELLTFFCTEMVKRITEEKKLKTVKHEQTDYNLNIIKNKEVCVCMICDNEYPFRVSFSVLQSVLDEKYTLDDVITKCQNPHEFDQIMRIQKNMEATKDILIDTIDKTLQRGEKLDDLIDRSETLSQTSKDFYKYSKKMNSCCTIS